MLILAVAAVVLSTATSHATPGDQVQVGDLIQSIQAAENPGEAFNILSPEEQEAIIEYLTGGTTTVVTQVTMIGVDAGYIASSNETCARQTKTTTFYSLLGTPLWKYISKTLWCWNGTEITNDPLFTRHVWAQWPWVFAGHLDRSESGGQGDWVHRDYTQGHFKQCWGGDDECDNHMYPELSKAQYGDGSSE